MAHYKATRKEFTHNGNPYVAVHFQRPDLGIDCVEIYRVHPNGLECFEGYASEFAELASKAESARTVNAPSRAGVW